MSQATIGNHENDFSVANISWINTQPNLIITLDNKYYIQLFFEPILNIISQFLLQSKSNSQGLCVYTQR